MRLRAILALALTLAAIPAAPAAAAPVSGPHETIDNQLTTTRPNAPSGFTYTGVYHAAGNPNANPPYMRKMVSYNPGGSRFDTSVPARCTASDLQLEARGTAACPSGSWLGGGTTTTAFLGGSMPNTARLDLFNNTNEEIILVQSPGLTTVDRGTIFPDGSVEFSNPTCFPYLQPPGCTVDDVLELGSHVVVPAYTTRSNGVMRSWLTTPPTCPSSRYWANPYRFWWADGSVDTVVVHEPCRR
jgi:hypothetical protein